MTKSPTNKKKVNEGFTLASDAKNSAVMKFLTRDGAKAVEEYTIDVRTGFGEKIHNELYGLGRMGLISFKKIGEDGYNLSFKMKLTPKATTNESKKTIKEGVLDDMDDDGFMAKRQLYDLAKYAVELHRMIQDTDNLEPWVQAKITKAADYISTVKHYLEYQGVRGAEGTADQMGADDMADIDDMDAQVVATGEIEPLAPLMADADPTIVEEETLDGMDILRMAKSRGIISQQQYEDPEPILLDMAQGMADMLTPEDVSGSSDVSILMKEFVATAEAELVLLLGPKVDAYYSMTEAKRIYERMMRNVKGKK
jgi:hypothetical protein